MPEFKGLEAKDKLVDFISHAVRATYAPPPWQKHSTALLPGLTPPPPVLEAHDQPQFGKFLSARGGEVGGKGGKGGKGKDGKGSGKGSGKGKGYGDAAMHEGAHGYRRAPGGGQVDEARINSMISRRVIARQTRDFAMADRMRDELRREGIEVDDSSQCWRVIQGAPGGKGGGSPQGYG